MSEGFQILSAKPVDPPKPLFPDDSRHLVVGILKLRYGALEIEGAQLVHHAGRKWGSFRVHMPTRGRARRIRFTDAAMAEKLADDALLALCVGTYAPAEIKPVAKASSNQETDA